MAQDIRDHTLDRSGSFSRLNARAPEFVPRVHHHPHHNHVHHQPVMHVVYQPIPPPSPPVSSQFVVPANQGMYSQHHHYNDNSNINNINYEYFGEHEVDLDQDLANVAHAKEGLLDEIAQKIIKQVEYYFSDANLATTEHLMRFITKDPEGFVPISIVASFKKIKALAPNNSVLADALRTSSKLVVSEDGNKVKREQPITESDIEELQSRIIVAENLPDNHCYQSLMKIFSVVGSVKTIRTCYPQAPNGSSSATNRSSKLDMLFANKLHAFVEYESADAAEKALSELNDGRNWRNGLRVRLLSSCMVPSAKQGPNKGRKSGPEGDGNAKEEDASTADLPKVKQAEHDPPPQSSEALHEHNNMGEEILGEKENGQAKRNKGRGRGDSKGRGRGHYNHSSHHNHNHHHRGGPHKIGTPPSHHHYITHNSEQPAVSKQPPGPRMPDGTRGFTMGRGKPLPSPSE